MTQEESLDRLAYFTKLWVARITTSLAIVLTIPTLAIMLTWNTLPGQKLYPVKRMLEDVALKLVGNSFAVKADLQTQFVEQRFKEAETLLTQSSDVGLPDLIQQIQVTKAEIISASNKEGGKDKVVAQAKASKLVVQLKEYNQKLDEIKRESPSTTASPTKQPGTPPSPRPSQVTTQSSPVPSVMKTAVVQTTESNTAKVEVAQAQITLAIAELQSVSGEGESNNLEEGKQLQKKGPEQEKSGLNKQKDHD